MRGKQITQASRTSGLLPIPPLTAAGQHLPNCIPCLTSLALYSGESCVAHFRIRRQRQPLACLRYSGLKDRRRGTKQRERLFQRRLCAVSNGISRPELMVLAAVALTIDIPDLAPDGVIATTTASACDGPLALAARVLTAVERALLRALAFVLYQLNREHARYCATSALQWYLLLQAQLPVFAVKSLDKATASISALADASFTDFWLSLLGSEGESTARHSTIEVASTPTATDSRVENEHEGEQNLVARLYEYITCSILGFFMGSSSTNTDKKQRRNLTPCTSPVNDIRQRSRRRVPSSLENDFWNEDQDEDEDDVDMLEPGWAIEYMEQDLMLPTDMKRRMESMMHSTVPLNLFRATVMFPSSDADSEVSEDDDDSQDISSSCGSNLRGFIGAITPGSLPPTPITRDLQARRMHHYTVFVLDRATLALQMLETTCS